MLKVLRFSLLATFTVGALAACGGGGSSSSGSSAAPAPAGVTGVATPKSVSVVTAN